MRPGSHFDTWYTLRPLGIPNQSPMSGIYELTRLIRTDLGIFQILPTYSTLAEWSFWKGEPGPAPPLCVQTVSIGQKFCKLFTGEWTIVPQSSTRESTIGSIVALLNHDFILVSIGHTRFEMAHQPFQNQEAFGPNHEFINMWSTSILNWPPFDQQFSYIYIPPHPCFLLSHLSRFTHLICLILFLSYLIDSSFNHVGAWSSMNLQSLG